MRSLTSLHESRVHGPQNFRSPVHNDFCNKIGPDQERDGLPAVEIGDRVGRRRRASRDSEEKIEGQQAIAASHGRYYWPIPYGQDVSSTGPAQSTLVQLARAAANDYLAEGNQSARPPMTTLSL